MEDRGLNRLPGPPRHEGAHPACPHRTAPPIDLAGAAEYLGITPRHVRRLVEHRRISYLKIGNRLRFLTEDLDEFFTECRVAAQ